ncbi:MAG: 2-C-methyl-D-erythritol 4-phosphate cytidylyltransferase [Bacteroidales bacterium]|nr:2-C-methyl-D-erythritol 4-phosphate cytidylyltransferase [Bacteroidales bacterium]
MEKREQVKTRRHRNIAILLSGGIGNRMNQDIPKQYIQVGGKPIIYYSLKALLINAHTDMLVIVIADEWKSFVEPYLASIPHAQDILFAEPGETRQYSVYNALKVIAKAGYEEDDIVLIHEAARPLATQEMIDKCYLACEEADCVVPVMPVKDTLYFSEDGKLIGSLLERSKIWSGQAPEAFRFGKYLRAHLETPREVLLTFNGGTELAFHCGMSCRLIEGDPFNFKITTQEDLTHFKSIMEGAASKPE